MKAFYKKKRYYIPAAAIVLIIAAALFLSGKKDTSKIATYTVARHDISEKISVTGKIKSASDISLSFDKAGKIKNIAVEVGDKVVRGQVLATMDNDDLWSQLNKAKAEYQAEEAKLRELLNGSSADDIDIQKVKVNQAGIAYDTARRNAVDALHGAYTYFDDAIHNKIDQFFSNGRSSSPVLNLVTDSVSRVDLENRRAALEQISRAWDTTDPELEALSDPKVFETPRKNLQSARVFLDKIAYVVNGLTSNSSLSQTTIDLYKSAVATARTNINTALSSLTENEQAVSSAKASLDLEKTTLRQKQSPARPEDISAQNANLQAAKAHELDAEIQYGKTFLKAPIDGTVIGSELEPGETVVANSAVFRLSSSQGFKIEASVTESDIGRLRVGNTASFDLDAYPDVVFKARVVSIDPAETIIDGVPTYKTTLEMVDADPRFKSGLTANIDIASDTVPDVIVVPVRAITQKNNKKYVTLIESTDTSDSSNSTKIDLTKTKELEVTTGIRDGEGNIEVISGLKAGDVILAEPASVK